MTDKKAFTEALGGVLDALSKGNSEAFEAVENHAAVQKAIDLAKAGKFEEFYFALMYPFEQVMDSIAQRALPESRNAQFLMKHSEFVESHFVNLIEKYEGRACSADKSRTILSHLLAFFIKGKRIEFNYAQEYTYHLPKKIFTTHEEILGFFEGVQRLYYGRPDEYLKALMETMKKGSDSQ